jgi:hypothetical protein
LKWGPGLNATRPGSVVNSVKANESGYKLPSVTAGKLSDVVTRNKMGHFFAIKIPHTMPKPPFFTINGFICLTKQLYAGNFNALYEYDYTNIW